MLHNINIIIHITAGTIAMLLGILLLIVGKGTVFHRRWGRAFVRLLLVVNVSAFLGWLFFRSNPFLLMLTLLASYNTYSGYRAVRLKTVRGNWLDKLAPVTVLATALFYLFYLMRSDTPWSPAVIYPTVAALTLVTVYDILKSVFLHSSISHWWLYEHIYKITSAFGAVLSAFVGTVLPQYKPLSQAGPGVVCWIIIIFFIIVEARKTKKKMLNINVRA